MKKRYSVLAGVLALALTGCSLSAPASNDSPESTQEDQVNQGDDTTQEAVETESEVVTAPEIDSPIYKVVTRYYHEYYNGSYAVDNEGNSLENMQLFKGKAQAIMLTEECKDAYPALYKALYDSASDYLQGFDNDVQTTKQYAHEDLENSIEGDYYFYGPYTSLSTVSIARADDKVVSICDFVEDYSGGAHGNYGMSGMTYDVQTGAMISLDQVVKIPEEELNPIIIEKINSSADEYSDFWDLEETLAHYRYHPDTAKGADDMENYEYSYTWYLANDGIHFYFGPYEIGPYSNGDTDICIGYDEVSGAIDEQFYPDNSRGYVEAYKLPQWSAEGDSDTASLHLVYEKEDSESYDSDSFICKSLSLKNKDKSAKADIYFDYDYIINPISSYYVCTADDREYIYVSVLSFSDYTELLVFDVSDDDIKLVGQDSFHYVYVDDGTDFAGELVWTDPENICLGQVGDMLGTYTCYAAYKAGPDGMPVLAEDEFTISWCSEDITLAKELTVPIIDYDGFEQSTETLPAGTHITPIKTDNSSNMDCQLDDGRMIRLNYSSTDYPAEIDGQKVDDLFENLQYAG